ncbi:cytosine-5--methyltransferase [Ephemerocybe angulata]|uniref:Cytosine-5--methyltransferase n=1 Tax=Ephemerocybe angulata TaxID=980116 RepID=A0A8H6I2R5_9AGAR|nr:cytosine-5--methyltransferase [Tulosesus angulatus]
MGRANRRGGKGGRGGKARGPRTDPEGGDAATGRTDLIEKMDMHNERFSRYYKMQKLFGETGKVAVEGAVVLGVEVEGAKAEGEAEMETDKPGGMKEEEGSGEFEEMLSAFRRHLPTTFRIAGSRMTVHSLNKTIADVHVPGLNDVIFEGERIPPPVRIDWYPDGCAWQFNVPKKVLRKQPQFKKFHSFLVFETEVGNISRQEAVSMIPPLFLDVEPHHKVMDMCAAPGSKTAQILEALHAQDTSTSSSIPSGVLIANDSDNKRTHLLIHQSARLPSPALMVTNLDASNYPAIRVPRQTADGKPVPGKMDTLLFDRILCDVPCSGDGTMRKNIGIWKSWQPMDGNGLHVLQTRILQRGMKMLAPNGRIVYSTCSLNPVENEAVIASALKANPEFHLVDPTAHLPALHRRPGLHTWLPSIDRTATTFVPTYDALMASTTIDANTKARFVRSQWPPSAEEAKEMQLERCMRIYPHLQDTGGFFVAVLERKGEPSGVAAAPSTTASGSATATTDESATRQVPSEEEDVPESKRARIEDAEMDTTTSIPADSSIAAASVAALEEEGDAEMKIEAVDSTSATPDEVSAAPSPSDEAGPSKKDAGEKKVGGHNKKKKGDAGEFKENPYHYLPEDHPLVKTCLARLQILPTFPSSTLLVRNPPDQPIRSLYLSNTLVRSIIENNSYQKLRLTAAGTKIFTKQEGGRKDKEEGVSAQYRILGEGLPVVLPFVREDAVLKGDLGVLRVFLESYYPLVRNFDEAFREQIERAARERAAMFGEEKEGGEAEEGTGSMVVRFSAEERDGVVLTHDLVLPIWKSSVSLSLMIDKKAKSALSLRLFGEDLMAKVTKTEGDGSGKKPEADVPVLDAAEIETEETSAVVEEN